MPKRNDCKNRFTVTENRAHYLAWVTERRTRIARRCRAKRLTHA